MAEKFNSIVRTTNDFTFDVAKGQTGLAIVDGLINIVKDAAMGALSGSVIGNIPLAVANNSYVKIPDHWTESSCNLHTETYT
ncbi:hypothetical protein, partial [Pseudomonas aeruginosa]|uniref:hypothetical protein n=1 Tax=Pseudomonas aeruginosa TaxID=287 RepID=UPI001E345306